MNIVHNSQLRNTPGEIGNIQGYCEGYADTETIYLEGMQMSYKVVILSIWQTLSELSCTKLAVQKWMKTDILCLHKDVTSLATVLLNWVLDLRENLSHG